MKRRHLLQAASAVIALPSLAWAQDKYPGKPITLICPYAAGGNADQRSRQIGRFISTALGQPVLVDNKPGAGGNIGTEAVAHAKPDGYVIGMGNFAPLAVNPTMFKKMNFDPAKELVPVCLIEKGPLVLMVPASSQFKSVKDIIAAAKASPGKLSFASGGLGGSHHLSGEMFKSLAGLSITHIPYKGGAPATTDLMGGQVDMMFEQMYSAAPSIRAGKLRALAITSKTRSPLFPDLPTMAEAGVPGFEVQNWQGLVAPAGTPAALIKLLNETVNKALADPTIKEQMLGQGNELGGGTPEQFAALIKSEADRWGKLVKSANIRPE
ncbi:tripartite tricarboxylate transporter substrate binding protein [Polaromonas sp. JS666]|uniref:Bug family tripartite tricarboxylate transporter substrate binding protein n=1 Tax=Polaromonas sp. (strain JS666 / ATCC BAA-500) TaxID=296591 RepID=UPI0008872809|nr:tripartite tricarboxylate transporter substrate binding protein [Polaromonas sp. JS666]SDN19997.1 Tripartite-type tricarboxylate transporter, receptor component TctC [Polaromonas sp. JS666]